MGHTQAAARPKTHTLKYISGYGGYAEEINPVMDPLNRAYKWGGRVQDVGPVPPFAVSQAQAPQPQRPEPYLEPGSTKRHGRVPNWIAYDRTVLGFKAFYREEVPNSPLESWRIRRVIVRYYLENDQVEIAEMREENSGLPQGVLLKRHCAVKEDGSPLRWPDLRVGGAVGLYRRTYQLVGVDASSRAFYAEQGEEQPPDEAFPEGPFDQRKALEASRARAAAAPPAPTRPAFTGRPPLPNDDVDAANDDARRHSPRGANAIFRVCAVQKSTEAEARDTAVLRFYAAWDNTAVTFGEVLGFSLFYYVADGTVEVREVHARNSGRDPFPLLLSRGRLPKTLPPVYGRPMSPRSHRLLKLEYYDWRDLALGVTVNVYGRSLLLYDCDEATRVWLRQNVPGISDKQLRPIDVDFDPFGPKRPPMAIPPHTSGFGSEEDSLQNVLHLVPRPPPKPYTDYLLNWNKVLRFEAAMAPLGPGRPLVGPHDAERRFIVNFHLLDSTLSVWEPKRKNSGMEQGTFLERTRVLHPVTGLAYADTDMQVGAMLELFGRGFVLLDADAYTLRYMEKESWRFPWADYQQALTKLRTWLAMYPDELPDRLRVELLAADPNGLMGGYIGKYKLHELLSSLGSDLGPHEVVTLVRQLGADRQGLLAEQLLAALGLAPPYEPSDEEPQFFEAPPQEPAPAGPTVPFPAPGHSAAAARHQLPRHVAWAPHPEGPLALTRGASAPAPEYPRGLGPTPGHPRVEPPPTRYQHRGEQQPHRLWGGDAVSTSDFSTTSASMSSSMPDDRQPRDTPEKGGGAAGRTGAGFRPLGVKQPVSLWQTTNNAYGGVGHANSYRR